MICAALAVLALFGASASADHAPKAPASAARPTKAATHAAKEPGVFSRWIEDLPVMPGLTETDAGYSFEMSRGGRLAEARLHGVVDAGVVRSFYASTLPALGWRAEAAQPYAYRRGRERLLLHVSPAKPKGVLAVFVLTPEGAAATQAPSSPKDVL